MAALGSLVVSLEANTAQFTAGMDKAAYQTDKAMREMKKSAEAVGKAIGALGVVGAGALAVMVKNAIDAADNLRDMSQKAGIAVETMNGLGFAASQAGGSLEGMVSAAGKLNKSIAEAAGGNKEAGEAFKALGIDVLDASGNLKKADEVIAEVSDKFAQFQDGPEKAALALRLFGKSGADMIPMLNEGGEALRANIEYSKQYSNATTELSEAADKFNDVMGKLTLQQKGFANAMADAVLPILQLIAEETLGAAEASNKYETATGAVRTVLEALVVAGSEVAFVFKGVGTEIGGIAAQLDRLARGDLKGFNAISTAMKADAELARQEHDKFIADVLNRTPNATANQGFPLNTGLDKPSAPRMPGTTSKTGGKDPNADFKAYLNNLQSQIQKTQELTTVEKLLDDIRRGSLTVGPDQQAKLTAIAQEIDATKEAVRISNERVEARRKEEASIDEAIRRNQEAAIQEKKQIEANVENIRIGLMSELEQETLAHELRIEELQRFHDLRMENEAEANALIEAEKERHEKTKVDIERANQMQSLAAFGDSASQLYGLMQQAGMEQTALGKALFIANKAIAVAEIIMNTEVGAAKALAFGPIAGPILSGLIRGMGYASAGIVIGQTIASAEGGYDIPKGTNPITQLHEEEMVLPKEQANVIRGLATNGGGTGGDMKLTIVNQTKGSIGNVVEQRISPTERALIIQEAVGATAAQLSDPNSTTSRSMNRNFSVARSR